MPDDMVEIEPGLHASCPVTRLTHSERRCVHGYYTMCPISADGRKLVYFEFDRAQVDRRPETLHGRVVVAAADGSSPETLVELQGGSPSAGAMPQWVGRTLRAAAMCRDVTGRQGWVVVDTETGQRWEGEGGLRSTSPEGTHLFLQTGEMIHLEAEAEGRRLAPEDVAARVVDYETDETDVRISVADVTAAHPEADDVRKQHMILKQTQFSTRGTYLSFVLSNAKYSRAHPEEPGRHELFYARRDGSDIRRVGRFGGHPSWDPKEEYIFAHCPDSSGKQRFMRIPLDGSPSETIGPDWIGGGHPSLRPGDARYMAVDVFQKGRVILRIHDMERLTTRDVLVAEYEDTSNDSGTHLHPAWTVDGKSVVINSANSGTAQLYRVDLF